jgi:hypothetical protein
MNRQHDRALNGPVEGQKQCDMQTENVGTGGQQRIPKNQP